MRTISHAHSYYENGSGWDVFDHAYIQPNNLWSDYTPVVSVGGAPPLQRRWLPLIGGRKTES